MENLFYIFAGIAGAILEERKPTIGFILTYLFPFGIFIGAIIGKIWEAITRK